MSEVVEEARAFEGQALTTDQSVFDRARGWGQRPQISLGAAAVLAIGASIGTRIYLRRRAEARMRRLARLAVTARSLRTSLPPARTTAPVGGVGAAALLVAAVVARGRRRRTHSKFEELSDRLVALEAQAAAPLRSDRPRPRDVVIGGVIGLGLAGLGSRVLRRRSS